VLGKVYAVHFTVGCVQLQNVTGWSRALSWTERGLVSVEGIPEKLHFLVERAGRSAVSGTPFRLIIVIGQNVVS
jgi:hypothetical protein